MRRLTFIGRIVLFLLGRGLDERERSCIVNSRTLLDVLRCIGLRPFVALLPSLTSMFVAIITVIILEHYVGSIIATIIAFEAGTLARFPLSEIVYDKLKSRSEWFTSLFGRFIRFHVASIIVQVLDTIVAILLSNLVRTWIAVLIASIAGYVLSYMLSEVYVWVPAKQNK